jgi:hypothetical protein
MKNIILSEELNSMKYLLGYKRGVVISEQAVGTVQPTATATTQPAPATATPTNTVDLIKQIQTILKTKYNANLGTTGPNKDGIDGMWGKNTQAALETALKSVQTAPAATTTTATATTTQPAVATTTTAPAATAPATQFKPADLPTDIGFKPSTPALK